MDTTMNLNDAARDIKWKAMTYPDATMKFAIDRNNELQTMYYVDGGHGQAWIMDKEGRHAAHFPWPPYNARGWRAGYAEEANWIYINFMAREIAMLLKNNGNYLKDHLPLDRFDAQIHSGVFNPPPKPVEGAKLISSSNNTITKIDLANGFMEVKMLSFKKTNKVRLTPTDDAFLLISGHRISLTHEIMAKFKVGDNVKKWAFWAMPDGSFVTYFMWPFARSISFLPEGIPDYEKQWKSLHAGSMWLHGKVKQADVENRKLIIIQEKLPLKKMLGYNLINKNRDNLVLSGIGGRKSTAMKLEDKVKLLDSWSEIDKKGGEAARRFSFSIDDAVLISLNGTDCKLSELKPGDRISIKYDPETKGSAPRYVVAARLP